MRTTRALRCGRFVQEWDDEGARKGWCLYKMGCKGPEANFNCPTVRWNGGTSWPVKAGHGCIACASPRFWDTKSPFYERLPHPAGFGVDVIGERDWLDRCWSGRRCHRSSWHHQHHS